MEQKAVAAKKPRPEEVKSYWCKLAPISLRTNAQTYFLLSKKNNF